MPRRYPHCWRWQRIVMSPLGPPRTTRFVLCGYMLFMHPQGDGCYVSVRRLAEVTGLNKDTVAEHRERALRTGWLTLAPVAERSHRGEVWTSLPEEVFAALPRSVSGARYSQAGVDIRSQPPLLSGSFRRLVRNERSECPAGPDISLRDLSIYTSNNDLGDMSERPVDISPASPKASLLRWLIADLRAHRQADDLARVMSRVPPELQITGYQGLVERSVAEIRNASAERDSEGSGTLTGYPPKTRGDGE